MKNLFISLFTLALLFAGTCVSAQTAGSVAQGACLALSQDSIGLHQNQTKDTIRLDLDCNGLDDVLLILQNNMPAVDMAHQFLVESVDPSFKICGSSGTGLPTTSLYNLGQALNCASSNAWQSGLQRVARHGGLFTPSLHSATDAFIAFEKGSQKGWIKVNFSVYSTLSTDTIFIRVKEMTALCSTASNFPVSIQGICKKYVSPSGKEYTASGNYIDTLANAAGCDSLVPLILGIDTIDTRVVQVGSYLAAVSSSYNYRWLDCNNSFAPIFGAKKQSFVAPAPGTYAVELNDGGCRDTSICLFIGNFSLDEAEQRLLISPNPSDGLIKIEAPALIDWIRIYSLSGKALRAISVYETSAELDFSNLPKGVYLIKVETENNIYQSRWIKN